jgi:hypothetical protein
VLLSTGMAIALAYTITVLLVLPYLYYVVAYGEPAALNAAAEYSADLLSFVIPSHPMFFGSRAFAQLSSKFHGDGEQVTYLNVGFIVLILLFARDHWREPFCTPLTTFSTLGESCIALSSSLTRSFNRVFCFSRLDLRRGPGLARDHRPDCKQVYIVLVVTGEGMPPGYEVFAGNRTDVTTMEEILTAMEARYGMAQRIWLMDRGMTCADNLAWLHRTGRRYLIGTSRVSCANGRGRLLSLPCILSLSDSSADTRGTAERGDLVCPRVHNQPNTFSYRRDGPPAHGTTLARRVAIAERNGRYVVQKAGSSRKAEKR